MALNALGRTAPVQALWTAAYSSETLEALRIPSAQEPRAANLVVFPNRLRPGSRVRVYDDSGLVNATLAILNLLPKIASVDLGKHLQNGAAVVGD